MISLLIDGDTVEITGDIDTLPKTINLFIQKEEDGKLTISDPIPYKGEQIANAALRRMRDVYGRN